MLENNLDALFQASALFLDNIRGIFQPLELTVERLVTEIASDLQETIDCTVLAVENVFSLGGMFATNPEYERRCKGVLKDVTPQDTQQTDTRTAYRSQIIKEMARGNNGTAINETDRVFVISKMIRQELDNLPAETKKEFNIHDIDLEHVSIQEILAEIRALYKIQQSNRSSSRGNEIHLLFDKILEILRVTKPGGQEYSDDDEVKEIFKKLEKQEQDSLKDVKKKVSVNKDEPKKNIVQNVDVNKLQNVIRNIPKTLQDIAKKRFSQGSTNGIHRSNTSEIIHSLEKTTAVNNENVNVNKNYQNTSNQTKEKSKSVNINQIIASNKEYHNIDVTKSSQNTASQIIEESKTVYTTKEQYVSNSIQKSDYNVLHVTNSVHSIANQIMEDSNPVDSYQIVKSTEDVINIRQSSEDQEEKLLLNNIYTDTKETKSQGPKTSVPLQGFSNVGVDDPISQNAVPAAPSITPPAIMSTDTTITKKSNYDDYKTQTGTDEMSFVSQFFDSEQTVYTELFETTDRSDTKDSDAVNEAVNIVGQSRFAMNFFNKLNMASALDVFDNPELL